MHSHDKIAEVFDQWAQSERAQKMADGHQFAARYDFTRLEVEQEDRYLDIGCGLGYSVRWAAELSSSVHALGVDVSGAMVTKARNLAHAQENAHFRQGHFPAVVAGETFNRIFSVEALYYLPDLATALIAVFNALKPGGRFVAVIDHYHENEASHAWTERVNVPLVLWTIDEWRMGMQAAGFINVQLEQLRYPESVHATQWQTTVGSLVLVGDRTSSPSESSAQEAST